MKISKSKQELARIISENGGWPCDAEYSSQDGSDGQVSFYKSGEPIYNKLSKIWNAPGSCVHMYGSRIKGLGRALVIKNFHQTILSLAEYFHLYPAPDADGWIEWKGGECPVGAGDLVGVKYANGTVERGLGAGGYDWDWKGEGLRIIAYRLHKPEQAKPEFCESAVRSIPDPDEQVWTNPPTIEQLAADYRNAKDYAERKQQEADVAKADAEAKLKALELAGEALGLVLGIAPVAPALVIADWRDLQQGDIVMITGSDNSSWESRKGLELVVRIKGDSEEDIYFGSWVMNNNTEWRFIRRP